MNSVEFLTAVERFIARRGLYPTAFGRDVMSDGSFVFDLRSGRSVTLRTQAKVIEYIEKAADVENKAA